jgi:hypothetical protein
MAAKVAVVGRFDPRSASLDRVRFCLTRMLQEHELLFLSTAAGMPTAVMKTLDWVLLWRDSLLCEAMPIWRQVYKRRERSGARIGGLGIAVHEVPHELKRPIAKLLDASGFCFVRDAATRAALNDHERVEVFTDVTWCSPLPGSPAYRETADVAVHLRPHLLPGYDPRKWLDRLAGFSALPFPMDLFDRRERDWLVSHFSEDVSEDFTPAPLKRSRMALVSSYHAAVFAMQLGKPFLAIDHDHYVNRLMCDAGLEDCLLAPADHDLLPQKIQYVLSERAGVRQRIGDYAERQRRQGARLVAAVREHLNSSSPQVKQNRKLD